LRSYEPRNPNLRVIANPGRIVSTGLNAAIREARGEFILRMDAHTRYAADYCRRCLETLELTGADNVGGPARTQAEGDRAQAIAAAYHSRFSTGGARFHDDQYEGWVDTVPYGCWRKQTLLRLGLFDEDLVRNQDDELNLRLVRAGGTIWQSPKIRSWYSPRSSLSHLCRQYFQYGFWKVAVIRKHGLPASWRHLVPVAFVLANCTLAIAVAVTSAGWPPGWFRTLGGLWLLLAAAYAGANLFASLVTAGRYTYRLSAYLPVVFAAYHLSYGLGFSAGLFRLFFSRTDRVDKGSTFARLTR
jgi:GT2 family glycosyltransferase